MWVIISDNSERPSEGVWSEELLKRRGGEQNKNTIYIVEEIINATLSFSHGLTKKTNHDTYIYKQLVVTFLKLNSCGEGEIHTHWVVGEKIGNSFYHESLPCLPLTVFYHPPTSSFPMKLLDIYTHFCFCLFVCLFLEYLPQKQ